MSIEAIVLAALAASSVTSTGIAIHQAAQKPPDPPPSQTAPTGPDPALARASGARSQEAQLGPRPSAMRGGSTKAGFSDVARTPNRGGALGTAGSGAKAGTSGLV